MPICYLAAFNQRISWNDKIWFKKNQYMNKIILYIHISQIMVAKTRSYTGNCGPTFFTLITFFLPPKSSVATDRSLHSFCRGWKIFAFGCYSHRLRKREVKLSANQNFHLLLQLISRFIYKLWNQSQYHPRISHTPGFGVDGCSIGIYVLMTGT